VPDVGSVDAVVQKDGLEVLLDGLLCRPEELLIKSVAIQKPCRDVVVVGAVPKGLGDEP